METKKVPSRRVLLVDDEDAIRSTLVRVLEKQGFEVVCADNGVNAQSIFGLDDFDLVISDIRMPGRLSGVDLLEYVRKERPDVPFILMTGFATLMETARAHEIGANGFLAKPFKREDLLRAVREALGDPEPDQSETAPPVEGTDEAYRKIGIDDFISGKKIQFSIYVRLSESKYVKIAHQGEDLAIDRIRAYKAKGIRHLYLTRDDFIRYMQFNIGLTAAVRADSRLDAQKKLAFLRQTAELTLERLYVDALDEEALEAARGTVDACVAFLCETPETFDLLQALNAHSDALYAHSLGVSLYSVLVARQVGWVSPGTLFKIGLGGLLHDIGKKEIDRAILEKPRSALTPAELRLIESHPTRGVELLAGVTSVPSDVLQIIVQHHERDSGTGYPFGLVKKKIHPLARLVAVVDEFCKLVIAAPGQEPLPPAQALERLRASVGGSLEPQFILALDLIAGAGEKAA